MDVVQWIETYSHKGKKIMIKNIFFDLDDTLLDFHLAERGALTKTLLHLNIEPKEEILARYSEINLSQWKLLEKGRTTREKIKARRFQLLFAELGIDCFPAEAADYYEDHLGFSHHLIPGAVELLEEVYKKYRLFAASNGYARVQRSRMESADITKYFAGVFISQEIGFNKPDIAFFNNCFARIEDFKKEETVIVGDSLSSDIKGGNAAGITTIWFNARQKTYYSIKPGYEIRRLSELMPLLSRLDVQ